MATTAPAPAQLAMATAAPAVQDAPATSPETEQLAHTTTASSRRSSSSSVRTGSRRPSLTRRTSLEEDYFYREVMTVEKRPTEPPPSYESTMKKTRRKERLAEAVAAAAVAAAASDTPLPPSYKGKEKAPMQSKTPEIKSAPVTHISASGAVHSFVPDDVLPAYSCDIHMEGVFQRKVEIVNATKRAEDRRWTQSYVVLHGTSLEIHECRKDRSWAGRTARTGPGVSPDRPPWIRKAGLERRYNLSYADAGIAADYVKRRYVIRIRAETDQFLLSCVELETFIEWLDALFAALSVAAPIDERDFPRDQSIPRLQRIRWYHGRDREAEAIQDRERDEVRERESERESDRESDREFDDGGNSSADDEAADVIRPLPSPSLSRPISPLNSPSKSVRTGQSLAAAAAAVLAEEGRMDNATGPVGPATPSGAGSVASNASSTSLDTTSSTSTDAGPSTAPLHSVSAQQQAASRAMLSHGDAVPAGGNAANNGNTGGRFSLRSIRSRLNLRGAQVGNGNSNAAGYTTNAPPLYQHAAVNMATGKWQPSHRWTKTHDMVYAKLCYATLLFRSPRKSNYIVMRGKQWLVDWTTGNMVRVSPPWYGEIESQPGPFQILRTENTRI